MITPLYKKLKDRGTTLYVFPGANEDVNAQKQNESYKVVFSKFALLNIPKRDVRPDVMDAEVAFVQSGSSLQPANYAESLVESLRNYVANMESTIRSSKTGPTTYFYDPTELGTVTERVFWRWLKNLGALSLEVADPTEDFFASISEFDNLGPAGNTDYFREYLWREREVTAYDVLTISEDTPGEVTVVLSTTTRFRPGDLVTVVGVSGVTSFTVESTDTTTDPNDTVKYAGNYAGNNNPTDATVSLNYQRVVNYVGEVPSSNSVTKADTAYTEVFAYVAPHAGLTPTVLFKTVSDANFRPGQTYPTSPSQYQPEIRGAENASSPILTNPTGYPGDQYGHFDAAGYLYETSTGDATRRSGAYYGVTAADNTSVDVSYPDLDGSTVDGLQLDFDIQHYVKAQSTVPVCNNFDEFSQAALSGIAPLDFEFNAVLWYYDVIDDSGADPVVTTNLYGIMFLDSPVNDTVSSGEAVPTITKFVTNGTQEGTSYTFAINLFTNTESEIGPQEYDPDRAKSLVEYDLFSEALSRLAALNEQFTAVLPLAQQALTEARAAKGLVYSLPSLDSVFARMDSLEANINAYKTLQLGTSDSIVPYLDNSTTPPLVRMRSVDRRFAEIYSVVASSLFVKTGSPVVTVTATPKVIPVPEAKDFLVVVTNDDPGLSAGQSYNPSSAVPNLEVRLERDLSYKQSVEFVIIPDPQGVENKRFKISVNFDDDTTSSVVQLGRVLDLPVGLNSVSSALEPYYAYTDRTRSYKPKAVYYSKSGSNRYVTFEFDGDMTAVVPGTRMLVEDAVLDASPSTSTPDRDISGMYAVSSVSYAETGVSGVQVVRGSTGYVESNTNYVVDISTSSVGAFVEASGCKIGLTFTAGVLSGARLLRQGSGFKPDTSVLYSRNGSTATALAVSAPLTVEVDSATMATGLTGVSSTPSTKALVKLGVKPVTRIQLDVTSNTSLTAAYDAIFSAGTPYTGWDSAADNTLFPLDLHVKSVPVVRFHRGYAVTVTRISDLANTQVADWEDRYMVDVKNI